MTPEPTIAEIEERLSKATKGLWTAERGEVSASIERRWLLVCRAFGYKAIEDAEFIAHAPANIAALIAEVRRLQEIEHEMAMLVESGIVVGPV